MPVLGLTNMVHTRDSSSSQVASPRSDLTTCARGGARRGESNGEVSGWIRRRQSRGRAFIVSDSVPRKSRAGADRAGGTEVRGRAAARGSRGLARVPRGGHLITALPQHLSALVREQVVGVSTAPRTADAAGGGAVRGRQRRGGRGTSRRRRARHASGVPRGARSRVATRTWYLSAFHPARRSTPPNTMASRGEAPAPRIRVSTRATSGGRPDRRCAGTPPAPPARRVRKQARSAVGSSTVRARLAIAHAASADRTPRPIWTSERKHPRKARRRSVPSGGTQSGVANFEGPH